MLAAIWGITWSEVPDEKLFILFALFLYRHQIFTGQIIDAHKLHTIQLLFSIPNHLCSLRNASLFSKLENVLNQATAYKIDIRIKMEASFTNKVLP